MLERLSIKLHNCRPDQLPPDLAERLVQLLASTDASVQQVGAGCSYLIEIKWASGCGDWGAGAAGLAVGVGVMRRKAAGNAGRGAVRGRSGLAHTCTPPWMQRR